MTDDRIQRLWGHIETMTPDEIRNAIRHNRHDRRVRKVTAAQRKVEKVRGSSTKSKLMKLLEANPDLLRELEDGSAD